jgi:hypothetical protein
MILDDNCEPVTTPICALDKEQSQKLRAAMKEVLALCEYPDDRAERLREDVCRQFHLEGLTMIQPEQVEKICDWVLYEWPYKDLSRRLFGIVDQVSRIYLQVDRMRNYRRQPEP